METALLAGPQSLARGYRLLLARRLRWYALLPFGLSALLLIGGFWLVDDWLQQWLHSWFGWLSRFTWLDWIGDALHGVALMLWFFIASFVFIGVAGILASPVNSLLSDRTRAELGQPLTDNFRWSQLPGLIGRSLSRELHKLLYMLPQLSLLVLLSCVSFWIPLLNLLTSALWFLVGAWLLALQYLDYPADSEGLSLQQTLAVLRRKRLTVLLFGLSCYLLLLIPGLNLLLLPAAICGATHLWLQLTAGSEPRQP